MPIRRTQRPSILAPAGDWLRKIATTDSRQRRRVLRWTGWIVGVAFAWSLISGDYSIPNIVRLSMEKQALIDANMRQTAELIDAERRRDLLLTDAGYIEFIARTQYQMVQPGEIVYRYARPQP